MKTRVLNFRLDPDNEMLLESWMEKNPGFSITQVGNLALRQFITQIQTLEKVTLEEIPRSLFIKALDEVLEEHSDAFERLK